MPQDTSVFDFEPPAAAQPMTPTLMAAIMGTPEQEAPPMRGPHPAAVVVKSRGTHTPRHQYHEGIGLVWEGPPSPQKPGRSHDKSKTLPFKRRMPKGDFTKTTEDGLQYCAKCEPGLAKIQSRRQKYKKPTGS